jgi:hypothetical protein
MAMSTATPGPSTEESLLPIDKDASEIVLTIDHTEGYPHDIDLKPGRYVLEWFADPDYVETTSCFAAVFLTYPDGFEAPVGSTAVRLVGHDRAPLRIRSGGTYRFSFETDCATWTLFVWQMPDK